MHESKRDEIMNDGRIGTVTLAIAAVSSAVAKYVRYVAPDLCRLDVAGDDDVDTDRCLSTENATKIAPATLTKTNSSRTKFT
mmetsp:Transcript_35784/g.66209  ORF Transcript_35784/g.66209 Transcript_35784/m.66209 type:complete len:82 (+) Transcript_35784:144-389(+)